MVGVCYFIAYRRRDSTASVEDSRGRSGAGYRHEADGRKEVGRAYRDKSVKNLTHQASQQRHPAVAKMHEEWRKGWRYPDDKHQLLRRQHRTRRFPRVEQHISSSSSRGSGSDSRSNRTERRGKTENKRHAAFLAVHPIREALRACTLSEPAVPARSVRQPNFSRGQLDVFLVGQTHLTRSNPAGWVGESKCRRWMM